MSTSVWIQNPRDILMIKAHSAGVGDLLRSSAAWRTLRNKWPDARLHLVFLTKQKGYASESLIEAHHLLASCHFIAIRESSELPYKVKKVPLKQIVQQLKEICQSIQPDLIIDFEASGIRTPYITRICAAFSGAKSLGIANVPLRRFFYDRVSPSVVKYAQARKLSLPMDYTQRDYVVLAALGLERGQQAIELNVQPDGEFASFRLRAELPKGRLVIGLNIGCGTPGAHHRRPNLSVLTNAVGSIGQQIPITVVLTGADFERDVNQSFVELYKKQWGSDCSVLDWSGRVSLSGLTGVIDSFDYFITTDSGPYHMAVAQRKPTLVLFTYAEVTAYHEVPWCLRLVAPYNSLDIDSQLQILKNRYPADS